MKTILLLSALSAAALMGAGQVQAHAAGASTPLSPFSSFHPPKPPKPVLHVPIGSYTTVGDNEGSSAVQGFNDVDAPTNYSCNKAAGCTILIRATVQVKSDVDANEWAICPKVDGNFPADSCEFIGFLSIAGTWTTGTVETEYTVAQGRHLINTQAVLEGGTGVVANYHVTYEFTTP